ncbi:MAG: NUDIX hydrolase [Actinobacteria bacterium]|nr:NUDIX hydrolase [Actinomycetota bacterium]
MTPGAVEQGTSGPGQTTAPQPVVRAAGGALWRRTPSGDLEVVVVHRPKYDDWSLPKGKCDRGEPDAECALREVEEETGYRCRLGPELPGNAYADREGRPKQVRYWAMTVVDGAFRPNGEVDQAPWVVLDQARRMLSYRRDAEVLDSLPGAIAQPG